MARDKTTPPPEMDFKEGDRIMLRMPLSPIYAGPPLHGVVLRVGIREDGAALAEVHWDPVPAEGGNDCVYQSDLEHWWGDCS